eukprot:15169_1
MNWTETVGFYWHGAINWALCFIITLLLTITHAVSMYQDLRTIERKSISHRASKPPVTKSYAGILIIVFISLFSYSMLSGMAVYSYYRFDSDPISGSTKCDVIAIVNAMSYQIAKGSMYIVFIGRIHTVYSQSSYGYKPILIFVLGLLVIPITATICVLEVLFHEHNYTEMSFGSYAMHCNVNYANFVVSIVAAFDFIMCIFSALAFIRPLIKIYRARSRSLSDVHTLAKLEKFRDVGQKYMIITCTAVLSTIIVMIWIGVTNTLELVPHDITINCICMALMTPYYRDSHYKRLCCCCNKCVRLCCFRPVSNLEHAKGRTPVTSITLGSSTSKM